MQLSTIALALTRLGGRNNSPSRLFNAGEQGVWYDPSDLSTLYQDSAGTTPVTAMEQPVGLMLDKSKGLVLGPEVVTNGGFDSDTEWNKSNSSCTISNGEAVFTNADSGYGFYQYTLQAGRLYWVTYTIKSISAGAVRVTLGSSHTAVKTVAGTYTELVYSTGTMLLIRFASAPTTAIVDNISVRELLGNHCTFKAGTGRPVLSARYNLYVGTETLATQNVTTAETNYKLTFTGTGTITLSGTATGTYSAGTHTITCTAGTLTSTVAGTVTKADFRAANDGVGLPVYQRVVDSATYDTAGFPPYLRADGTDDGGATNSIDFTGTDKITVFAGVRKLSDAGEAYLLSTSANWGTNAGSFVIRAPRTSSPHYSFGYNASSAAGYDAATYSAPISNVLSVSYDGAGVTQSDKIKPRVNSATPTLTLVDTTSGTGNCGNYPLYLFARDNAGLYFNGRLYGLIVLGRAATAMEIANTERYINQRGRIY